MLKKNVFLVSFLVLALTFSGCLFGGSALKELVISAGSGKVEQGKSINLEVKGLDKNKKDIKVPNPKWELLDKSKGEIKPDGTKAVFTASENAIGKVEIKVESGKISKNITIEITKKPDPKPDPANKKDLKEAIEEAEALLNDTGKGEEPGQAPEAAHTALQEAINAAKAVNANEEATQEQVDAAKNNLNNAIATFKEKIVKEKDDEEVDKTDLEAAIAEAEALDENTPVGIYNGEAPVHAHAALRIAIHEAVVVKDDSDATQGDVDEAVNELSTAIAEFESEIETDPDPLKVYTFELDILKDTFTTDKGSIDFNEDEMFIKTGDKSLKHHLTGTPSGIRIRLDKRNDWPKDWSDYDHLAAWIYIDDVSKMNSGTAVRIDYPMGTGKFAIPRSNFENGWNYVLVNLRDEVGLTKEQLSNMTSILEIAFRHETDTITYVDEIRLLKLEEDPIVVPVDKDELFNTITYAETLLTETDQGEEPGQAPEAAHNALQAAITEAQTVFDDNDATQDDVDTAVMALLVAIDDFKDAIISEPADPNLIIFEDFMGLENINDFWSADYKSLPEDNSKPMYVRKGGTISLVDGILILDGGRFTIGMPNDRAETTKDDPEAGGTFDLSKPYKITIEFTEVGGELGKKFQIYIDNSTTSGGKSIHASKGSTASRPYSEELQKLPGGKVIEQTVTNIGTDNSFVQIRIEGSGIIGIKSFRIEYL